MGITSSLTPEDPPTHNKHSFSAAAKRLISAASASLLRRALLVRTRVRRRRRPHLPLSPHDINSTTTAAAADSLPLHLLSSPSPSPLSDTCFCNFGCPTPDKTSFLTITNPPPPPSRATADSVDNLTFSGVADPVVSPPAAGEETLRALLRGDWLPEGAAGCRTTGERLEWLRSEIIGAGEKIRTPIGWRSMIYTDHTASGRPLRFVEEFMQHHILPFYGNTHTEDSFVGGATTRMTHMSEAYVKRQLGGGADDVLLFCGSGTTAAIKRLQEVMGVAVSPLLRRHVLQSLNSPTDRESSGDIDIPRWVVFTGPYEHHSNLLSWRQSLAEVVEILPDAKGGLDMAILESALRYHANREPKPRLLGAFSACSNVTGRLTHTAAVADLVHSYGGQVFFDFAAAAAHQAVDFGGGGYDAVALSPHKLAGGPGTPGILLLRRSLYALSGSAPTTAGGGTVSYVNGDSEDDTLYYENIEVREDAGTPQILGKIRCALTFWVQQFIGTEIIHSLETSYIEKAIRRLSNYPNIKILGHVTSFADHASIISFIINPTIDHKKPLHGRFVVRLLNDMFGIQARGGCACAGPYGHFLLGIDKETSLAIRDYIMKGYEGLKPGWTRVSFCYDMTEAEVNYVLSSIEWVAHYGHLFLHLYDFDWKTGNWTCIQPLRNFEPNVISAEEYIKDNSFEHMKNRFHLSEPLRFANALAYMLYLFKIPSMRDIPNEIDSRAVVFHF